MKIPTNIKKITRNAGIAFLAYASLMYVAQGITHIGSPKVNSQSQLEKLIEKEKEKLNCNKNITGEITEHKEAKSSKIDSKHYSLAIGGTGNDESALRHEVYHICDGQFELMGKSKIYNLILYFFYAEPKTTLHQIGMIE